MTKMSVNVRLTLMLLCQGVLLLGVAFGIWGLMALSDTIPEEQVYDMDKVVVFINSHYCNKDPYVGEVVVYKEFDCFRCPEYCESNQDGPDTFALTTVFDCVDVTLTSLANKIVPFDFCWDMKTLDLASLKMTRDNRRDVSGLVLLVILFIICVCACHCVTMAQLYNLFRECCHKKETTALIE
jgi:hypothetical protein